MKKDTRRIFLVVPLILSGITALCVLSATALDYVNRDDGAYYSVEDASVHWEPAIGAKAALVDAADDEPLSGQYARSLGYRSWNEYVSHRPANKMGVRVAETPVHVIQGAPQFDSATPSPAYVSGSAVDSAAGAMADDPYSDVADESVIDRRDLPPPFCGAGSIYIGLVDHCYPVGVVTLFERDPAGYDPILSVPSAGTSVPEPSALWLIVIGLAGLVATSYFRRRG